MSAAQLFLPYRIAAKPTNVGAPSAQMFVYSAGTTTKRPVYASSSLTTQLSNPVVADGAGRFSDIWLNNALTYKLVIKDKNGATLDTFDNYVPAQAPDASALQPYSDAASASATAASSSSSAASTSASAAATSASSASASQASALAYLNSLTALPTSGLSLVAASRDALALLGTGAPAIMFEPGREGVFVFKSAATILSETGVAATALVTADTARALFVPPTGGDGSTGAWVRKFTGSINPMWFGFIEGYTGSAGANSTANNAAWTAMMTALGALGKNVTGKFKGLLDVLFPLGTFEFSVTPDVTVGSLRIRGSGMGFVSTSAVSGATRIKCYGCGGFRFQSTNTSGIGTKDGATHQGSDASSLEDIGFEGDGLVGGTAEAEYHGVHLRAQTHLRNVIVANFAGDGFRLEGNTGSPGGTTNSSTQINCHAWGCRNGRRWIGNNTGASFCSGGSFNNNRRWGDKNESSIGSTFIGVEYSNNGTVAANDGVTIPATVVAYTGGDAVTRRYFALAGQELWCSTNPPSGDTTNNQGWAFLFASGAASGVPTWFSGILVETGGNFMGSGGNVAIGCYGEANNEGKAQGQQSDIIIGGKLSVNAYEGGTGTNALLVIRANSGGPAYFSTSLTTPGAITSTGDKIGYSSGAGGAVTQITNKSTSVTLAKLCGQVTMNNAALAAGAKVSFVVTNSLTVTTDVIVVNVDSGGTANAYRAAVTAVNNGSFTITVENITAGPLSEAPVISFAIIKAVAA